MALLSTLESRAEYRYRLTLDGKPGSEYIALSDRALERRARLGIEVDDHDLEVSPLYLEQLREAGLQILCVSRWLNTVVVMRPDGKKITSWDDDPFPFVSLVELLSTTQHATAPHRVTKRLDADFDVTPSVEEDCSSPLVELNAMQPLYEAGYRGQGMLVAVLDAGYYYVDQFPWLTSRIVGHRDLYSAFTGLDQTYSADSHGACCLSIMASTQQHGVWGSAQEAQYFLIRTETDDSETQFEEDMWVAGAELADSLGADIISSSLGYTTFDNNLGNHSTGSFGRGVAQISRGAQMAARKGILVCNAAGNDGDRSWQRLLFPADVDDVLTVGGTNPSGSPASFTSRGFTEPYVKPDVAARATSCYTLRPYTHSGEAVCGGAGTSYATPLIAGLCASLWSAVPALSPAQLRDAVRRSASQAAAPDSIVGYGRPDFGRALQLARELVGEEQSIDKTIADAPRRNTDNSYYNVLGQPLVSGARKGLVIISGDGVTIVR